ncbi:unnamed protein product [Brassica rapa subsp. trilocularis]
MKTLVICLLMISSVVIIGNVAEVSAGKGKYLDPGVLDRCLGSLTRHPNVIFPIPRTKLVHLLTTIVVVASKVNTAVRLKPQMVFNRKPPYT